MGGHNIRGMGGDNIGMGKNNIGMGSIVSD